jgi:hypothetical protein
MFFAGPVYNEQLYSLIVWSKVVLFSPWAKKHSRAKNSIHMHLGPQTAPRVKIRHFTPSVHNLLFWHFLLLLPRKTFDPKMREEVRTFYRSSRKKNLFGDMY